MFGQVDTNTLDKRKKIKSVPRKVIKNAHLQKNIIQVKPSIIQLQLLESL